MLKAIYKIENLINHKIYIGQTVNPKKRWWQHRHNAKIHYDNLPIHLAISKYGEENFSFTVLEWTEDYNNAEYENIKLYNSISPNGYNVSTGGECVNVMIGENHPRNTISNETLFNIVSDLHDNLLSDREIAKKYNTTDKIIADINHGYTHHINGEKYPLRIKKGQQKLTLKQVNEIKQSLKYTKQTYKELAEQYDVTKGVIYHINKGLTFYDNTEIYPLRKDNVKE